MIAKNYPSNISKKLIFLFSIPVFFSNLAIPLTGIIDTGLMGNLGESRFLAATSIATSVMTMIIWSFAFLRMGTVGIVAQLFGKSDYREIAKTLSRNFLIICLEAPDSIYQVLIDRFLDRPKPMYYEENFLRSLWQTFKIGSTGTEDKINPDDFMIFGFKALIERRKAIYDMIAKNWGIRLNFERLRNVKTAADLMEAIQSEIKSEIKSQ